MEFNKNKELLYVSKVFDIYVSKIVDRESLYFMLDFLFVNI